MGAFLYLKWAFPNILKGVVPKIFPGAPNHSLPPHFVAAGSAAVATKTFNKEVVKASRCVDPHWPVRAKSKLSICVHIDNSKLPLNDLFNFLGALSAFMLPKISQNFLAHR